MAVLDLRLEICPFHPDDLEKVTEFRKEVQSNIVVAGDHALSTEENVARWQRYLMKVYEEDKNQILVAKVDGKLVGYVFFLKRAEFPLETSYTWANMNEIYVHPNYRRRGFGTKLVKKIFDYLKSIGVTHVKLNVMAGNRAAICFHRKLGFEDSSLRMRLEL